LRINCNSHCRLVLIKAFFVYKMYIVYSVCTAVLKVCENFWSRVHALNPPMGLPGARRWARRAPQRRAPAQGPRRSGFTKSYVTIVKQTHFRVQDPVEYGII